MTLEQIYAHCHTTSGQVNVDTYVGRIEDYNESQAQVVGPIIVVDFVSGSATMIRNTAIQDDRVLRLWMLAIDSNDSGADKVSEQTEVLSRQTLIELMDVKLLQWLRAFTNIITSNKQRVLGFGGTIAYDRYTDKTMAGVGRQITVRVVTTNC